jgi:hypothetical protein
MKNLKEIVSLGIEVGHTFDKAFVDGKFDLSDLLSFIPVILKSEDAFKDAKLISQEWNSASFEEKQMLIKEIEVELDLKNDKTEKIIEKSLGLILAVYHLHYVIKG